MWYILEKEFVKFWDIKLKQICIFVHSQIDSWGNSHSDTFGVWSDFGIVDCYKFIYLCHEEDSGVFV